MVTRIPQTVLDEGAVAPYDVGVELDGAELTYSDEALAFYYNVGVTITAVGDGVTVA